MNRFLMLILLGMVSIHASTAQPGGTQREVLYRNVSFLFDASLAQGYVAETVPAVRLETRSDKPDRVAPAHIQIRFRDSYVPPPRATLHSDYAMPVIYFFPIADARDGTFTEDFPPVRQAADDLAAFLSRRSHPVGEPIPFLPWGDVHQAFIGKRKIVRFRNGRGLLFLTQYDQEQLPVNNSALVYTFQGLTDDNAWYVSAVFPVSAPGLPDTDEEGSTPEFARGYTSYIAATAERLEKLSPKSFVPTLTSLENIVRSVKVQGRFPDPSGSLPR